MFSSGDCNTKVRPVLGIDEIDGGRVVILSYNASERAKPT